MFRCRDRVVDSAPVTDGVFKILRFKLTMLIVTIRLLDRVGNSIKNVCGLLEDAVHLFEGAISSLGEEEVYCRKYKCVSSICELLELDTKLGPQEYVGRKYLHYSEDNIGLVPDAVECHGCDHHDHEVKDPVGTEQKISFVIFSKYTEREAVYT